jgi:uncharacterized protein involved in exopolysaccharide biosynthesis/Mrp family chromosome partitioning ATPase
VGAAWLPGEPVDGLGLLDLGAWLRRLLRFWWVIALAILLASAAAMAWIRFTPPRFESVATVRVEQERRPLMPGGAAVSGAEDIRALEMLRTIEQEMISRDNLRRVVQSLGLAGAPDFGRDRTEAEAVRALGRIVGSELRRGTRLIDVRVEDTDASRARDIAAALVDGYIDASSHQAMDAAREKSAHLRETLQRLEIDIRATEAAIQEYREKHRGLPLDEQGSLAAEKLRDLSTRLAQTVAERSRLEAARREIAALGPRPDVDAVLKIQGDAAGEDITSLKSSLALKEAEFARLQQRYLPRHPKYIQAATELDSLRRQHDSLGTQAATTLAAAAAQAAATERGLRDQIARAEIEALEVEKVSAPYRLMQSQLAGYRTSFDAWKSQLNLAEVAALAAPAVVSLVDAPFEATRPSKPRKPLVLAVAVTSGGLFGLALVLLGSLVRQRYDSAEEVERALRLPLLGLVVLPGRRLRGAALLDNPRVEKSSAGGFRALGAALSVTGDGRQGGTVLFFSHHAGGETRFVAANHALGLARQGYRTLLIDANLHGDGLDAMFFERRNPDGLANYLEGRTIPAQACRATHVPNLYLLSAGVATRHPSETLTAEKFRPLLADATRWFQRIVINAPALDQADDVLVMAQHADQLVWIVDRQAATRPALAAAGRRLALASLQPVGFVALCRPRSLWRRAAAVPGASGSLAFRD